MIRVGIVDDHAIVRESLRRFLSEQLDIRVVGEATNGREAIDLVRAAQIDVLLLDLVMPGQNGLDVLLMILAKAPSMGVLVLSGYPETQYGAHVIRKGASGYLSKDCEPAEILRAIRAIAGGRRYISASLAESLADEWECPKHKQPHEDLSQREFQVFLKLASGKAAPEIATDLSLSVKTISTYRNRVMEKLGLVSNSDLTYYALKHKLLD